ncbi:MAG: zinc ribbon domain-containing protein [Vicinamibacteria bacterium]|nr:zinc ribbon domain-containing protein [Vicinamibacteria bacterium]
MPIFEYRCDICGASFEKIVLRSGEEIPCPNCDSRKVTRQLSAFAFKSGSRFVSASASSCSGCTSSAGGCAGCRR